MNESYLPNRWQVFLIGVFLIAFISAYLSERREKSLEQVERQQSGIIDSILSISGDVEILGRNLRLAQDSVKLYARWLALCLKQTEK